MQAITDLHLSNQRSYIPRQARLTIGLNGELGVAAMTFEVWAGIGDVWGLLSSLQLS